MSLLAGTPRFCVLLHSCSGDISHPRSIRSLRCVPFPAAIFLISHFENAFPENGVDHLRGDFCCRVEDETPLVHPGMRDREPLGLDHEVAEKENVNIDGSRSPMLYSLASHFGLDFHDFVKKLLRRKRRVHQSGSIEKIRLVVWPSNRFGEVERAEALTLDTRNPPYPVPGVKNLGTRIPQIGPKSEKNKHFLNEKSLASNHDNQNFM